MSNGGWGDIHLLWMTCKTFNEKHVRNAATVAGILHRGLHRNGKCEVWKLRPANSQCWPCSIWNFSLLLQSLTFNDRLLLLQHPARQRPVLPKLLPGTPAERIHPSQWRRAGWICSCPLCHYHVPGPGYDMLTGCCLSGVSFDEAGTTQSGCTYLCRPLPRIQDPGSGVRMTSGREETLLG
jgi:hypothetical protein